MKISLNDQARSWIIQRSLGGASEQDIADELVAAGWQRKVAQAAIAQSLRVERAPASAAAAVSSASPVVVAVPSGAVPEPNLHNSPLAVDAGDRQARVLTVMREPRVVVFGDFLSAEECRELIAQAEPRMHRSQTIDRLTGDTQVDPARTSRGMFFQRAETALQARIETRIAKLLNWPVENGEGLQVLNYRPGAEYEAHYDYFDPNAPGTPAILKRGGQRIATLVMFLNTPERGGATTFPEVGVEVMPQQGNAVFFSYPRPDPATLTLHAGAPVLAGEKWVATKWLRERVFA